MPDSVGPARIWHTAGAYHPVPHAATVLTVGGSKDNLFSLEEHHIENVDKAVFLDFGMIFIVTKA